MFSKTKRNARFRVLTSREEHGLAATAVFLPQTASHYPERRFPRS